MVTFIRCEHVNNIPLIIYVTELKGARKLNHVHSGASTGRETDGPRELPAESQKSYRTKRVPKETARRFRADKCTVRMRLAHCRNKSPEFYFGGVTGTGISAHLRCALRAPFSSLRCTSWPSLPNLRRPANHCGEWTPSPLSPHLAKHNSASSQRLPRINHVLHTT